MWVPYNASINIWAFQVAKSVASPALNSAMLVFYYSLYAILPLIALYLYIKRDENVYPYVVCGLLLFVVSDLLLKPIFAQPRPCTIQNLSWINNAYCASSGYSFPSAHASVLTGLIVFLKRRRILEILYGIWTTITLFGAIYLGFHYLTDVIAGIALSILLTYVVYSFRNTITKKIRGVLRI